MLTLVNLFLSMIMMINMGFYGLYYIVSFHCSRILSKVLFCCVCIYSITTLYDDLKCTCHFLSTPIKWLKPCRFAFYMLFWTLLMATCERLYGQLSCNYLAKWSKKGGSFITLYLCLMRGPLVFNICSNTTGLGGTMKGGKWF